MKKTGLYIIFIIALSVIIPSLSHAQNTLDNLGLTATNPAEVAFSLRRLSSSYMGNAIQVRRSSDNATQNIGFTASGDLDQAALLSFVGSGNGFISIWYDQSGNGRNITASTAARQPAIVSGGVVNLRNNRPSILFDGTNDQLFNSTFPTTGFTGFSANMLASWTTVGNAQSNIQALLDNDHNGSIGFIFQDRPDLANRPLTVGYSGSGANDVITTGDGNLKVFTMVAGATTISGYRDGFNYQTGSRSGAFVHNNILSIGAWANGPSRFLNGAVPEVIIFSSAISNADRQTLETNQSCYYSTLPSITFSPFITVAPSTTSVSVNYSNAQFNLTTYSISWSAVALAAGFTDVTDAALPAGAISINLPPAVSVGGAYSGNITVKNACGTTSALQPLTISVLNPILGTSLTAQVAYSVRKLAVGYNGPAIRVRRSNDNTQQDIGFTAGGDLDQTALLAFVGSSNGFITRWYDQSGNGRDMLQNTVARQPRIVNAGVIDIKNARAGLKHFAVSQNFLSVATGFLSTNNWTVNSVMGLDGGTNQRLLSGAPNWLLGFWGGNESAFYFQTGNGGTLGSGFPATTALQVYTGIGQGASNASVFRNGVDISAQGGGVASNPPTNLTTGSYNGSGEFSDGTVQEVIVLNTSINTSDRQTIETNQLCYYSVPPTIALSLIPGVPANAPTASIPYTTTTINPATFSITWDAAALAAGFVNITDAILPASPISVNLPTPTVAGGIFNGILIVKTACGVQSINYPIAIRILNPILGTTQTAQAAYSIRKIAPAYNGPAIRVRRSSDNTTQDIGFIASGDLDEAALLAFVGSGNGFVSTWYDQSGNARNAVQNNVANQPRIVNSGVVDLANTRPTLTLSGGQNMISALTNAQAVGTGITATFSSVFRTNNGVNQSLFAGNANEYMIHAPWGDGNTYFDVSNAGQGRIAGQLNWSALSVATFLRSGALAEVYKNGVNSINSNSRNTSHTFSNSTISLFSNGNGSFTQGIVPEMIFFSNALSSSDRITIETDQTCYYSIPPTINLSLIPGVPANATTATIPYSTTTLNPATYTITWDAAALAAGFVNITDAILPASPISVNLPTPTVAGGIFNGILIVKTACGVQSINYPIAIRILNPILGTTQTAQAAYSIRKIAPAYNGPAIRVRRSSDNTTQDIGFIASGDLDEAALLAFVGSGNGFVSTWYDQSGNARNAVQNNVANQPRIVNSGVVDLANTRPTLTLSGGQNMISALTNAQAVGTGITATFSSVFRTNNGVNQSLFAGNGDEYNIRAPWGDGNTYFDVSNAGQGRIAGQLNWSALSVATFLRSGALAEVYKNGVNSINSNSRNTSHTFSNSTISLFSNGNGSFTQGIVPEMIFFSNALSSSDRITIETDQTCYYSIPPTINLSLIPGVPANATTATIPYSTTTLNPATYTITWDAAALAAGFVNITDAILPASPISVNLPTPTVAGGIFNGILIVKTACGVQSINYPIAIRILNPILGTTQTAQAAYSIRKIAPAYNGPAIRVRRSSDNTTQDIGFIASGDLDEAALLAFVGSGNGFVSTWYDQSGNARNAVQNNVANQPRIVNSGVVDLANTRPTLTLSGGQNMISALTNAQAVGTGITATFSSVFRTNNGVNQSLFAGNANEYMIHAPWGDGNTYFDVSNAGQGRIAGQLNWSALSVATFLRSGALAEVYKNGVNSINSNSRNTSHTFSNSTISLFSNGNGSFTQGIVPEMIFFSNALSSSDRITIETDQTCYYSIPPTINLSLIPGVPANATTATIPYSTTTLNPATYTITWDAAALAAGFVNITDAILPASPISVNLPTPTVAGGIFNGILIVKTACGVQSINYPIAIRILNPILGTTQTAQAAYSIRKIAPAYNGPAIRVRRSSDNTTQDIGFIASGDLDEAALLAFVGSGNGFVSTWYDQSGNARNAVQNNVANQPRIVNSGVVDLANTRPTLTLSGGQNMISALTNAQAVGTGITATFSSVFRTNNGVNQSLFAGNGDEYNIRAPWGDGNTYFDVSNAGQGRIAGQLNWSALSVATFLRSGALAEVYKNGVNSINSNSRNTSHTFSNSTISLFSNGNGSFTQGIVPEMIFFSNALSSSDRITIETDQTCYYSIPPTINLSLIPGVPANATTATIPYSTTTLNPATYTITWDAAALAAGFVNITDAILPASPISVNLPTPTVAGGIFNGILIVKTACGVQSINYPIAIRILNPILGTTQTAQAAYSIRKIAPAYNGPAIRVRRSSDNTTQDIGFIASGDLDEAALLAFVGSGNGFVSTWYDQSGNARNAVQNNVANQPRIVNSGVVDLANTRPTLTLSGGQNMISALTNAQAVGTGITATFSSVFRTNNGVNQSLFAGNANEYMIHAPWGDGNTYFDVSNAGQGRIAGQLNWSALSVATFLRSGALAEVYKNGVNSINSNSRNTSHTFSNSTISLFSNGNGSFTQGIVPEMIFFSNALSSSDRITIETNQDCYYSIGIFANYIDWMVQGTSSTSACYRVDEQVVWKPNQLTNLNAIGNSLIKIQSGGAWNGGAASWNTVKDNGYLQFTATETNTFRMVGLSNTNVNSDFNTIQYAIYLRDNAQFEVFESGIGRGNFGSYASNDVFKIALDAGVVKYFRNGILFYMSTVTPTLPLLVDVSINSQNGTVTNVIVSNYNNGDFTATLAGPFTSVNYQWTLNGNSVGSNSPNYSNSNVNIADEIKCTATITIGGCTRTLNSNKLTVTPIISPLNIDFYIIGTTASVACNTADEQVKWKINDLANTTITGTGNSLTKIQSGGAWNGGAASWNTVKDNGYLQFTATETNTFRMVGLSTTNANSNFNTIQYAIYLRDNAQFEVFESGIGRGNFGPYASNDVFRIAVDAGVVKYFRNGNLFYISTVAPTLPLLVDVSINSVNGTVTNAIVSNYNTGTFTANAINVGTNPVYQWKLNGNNVGSNSSTYTNVNLGNNDVILCEITPDIAGCSTTNYISNTITNKTVATPASIDFFITGTTALTACNTGDEQVKWKINELANTTITGTGNSLTKIQSGGAWNGGAASWNTVKDNGYLQFTATETNTFRMVGLSTTNANSNFNTIQYAIYLRDNAQFEVFESGIGRGNFGPYASNDVFRIAVDAGVVKYFRNGNLFYISTVAPTLPLLVDVSINSVNGTVTNAIVSNYNTGTFTANAINVGTNPVYQWKLNGNNVGSNSSTYTNVNLGNNDVILCEITPDIAGCSTTNYISNTITNKTVATPASIDFFITGTTALTACNTGDEQVKWKINELANTTITGTGNSLTKIQSGGAWNGGAASWNTVKDNGYLQFTATETNTFRMVGLSTTNANSNFNTIQYAIYLRDNAQFEVFESGIGRGNFGPYASNDVFRIAVDAGVVKYFRNGNLFYISTVSPTLPLLVDVSINSVNGTVSNAVVSNSSIGTFIANAVNVGVNPVYQWKLNGANVGTNSNIYTNVNLSNNDVILCELTPDLSGCTNTVYNSNTITISVISNSWNGIAWSSGTPISSDLLIFNGDYSQNVDLWGCSCTITSGNVVIPNGRTLTITKWLNVAGGSLTFENNSSLVQINDVANTGPITYRRSATNIQGQDYIYWSSPVVGQNLNTIYTTPTQGPKYVWNTTQNNGNGTGGNISQGNWEDVNNVIMQAARGYIVRGSNNFTLPATTINSTFFGVPRNGNITTSVQRGQYTGPNYIGLNGIQITNLDDNWNLIGNPYPSAINALQFLNDNSGSILGNVRLWKHGIDISNATANPFYGSFGYNYSSADYEIVNFTGSTTPGFNELIKTGQAFFVQMIDGPGNSVSAVNFNNGQRNRNYANNNFFRVSAENSSDFSSNLTAERHRIWLDIVNSNNASTGTLIGYVAGATLDVDSNFDAYDKPLGDMRIFSSIADNTFAIQGRPLPFNQNDLVPLVVTTPTTGVYNIAIRAVDGLFENSAQNIYLEDTMLGTIHDLRLNPYTFTSTPGTHSSRFVLRYTNETLNLPTFEANDNVFAYTDDNVWVKSIQNTIKNIVVYDLLGKKVDEYRNVDANEIKLKNLMPRKMVYILRITLENDVVVNKKIIF